MRPVNRHDANCAKQIQTERQAGRNRLPRERSPRSDFSKASRSLLWALRYAYWRTTSTLPPVDVLYSFIPGVVLYAGEMYCIVMLAISLFVVADPREREDAPRLSDEDAPSVDVFVPTYNEGKEILAMTLSAAKAMHYPSNKLRVFLLDDGGTDRKRFSDDTAVSEAAINRAIILKDLCADLGVTYLTRAENVHAKAENLNSGL